MRYKRTVQPVLFYTPNEFDALKFPEEKLVPLTLWIDGYFCDELDTNFFLHRNLLLSSYSQGEGLLRRDPNGWVVVDLPSMHRCLTSPHARDDAVRTILFYIDKLNMVTTILRARAAAPKPNPVPKYDLAGKSSLFFNKLPSKQPRCIHDAPNPWRKKL